MDTIFVTEKEKIRRSWRFLGTARSSFW